MNRALTALWEWAGYSVRSAGWKIRTGRIEQALAGIELFKRLAPEHRRQLARRSRLLIAEPGTIITEPGLRDRNLYVLATGSVRLSVPSHPDEGQRRGWLVAEGGAFGNFERALGLPEMIHAAAEEHSEVLVFDVGSLLGGAVQRSELAAALNESYLRTVFAAYLRNIPYLAQLEDGQIESLAARFSWGRHPAGAILFRQGDFGTDFYFLRRGRALLQVSNYDRRRGRRRTRFHELSEGDHFGELALLGQTARPASVRAITELSILTIRRDALLDFYAEYPRTQAGIEQGMLEYVSSRAWLEKHDLPATPRPDVRWLEPMRDRSRVEWLKRSGGDPVAGLAPGRSADAGAGPAQQVDDVRGGGDLDRPLPERA